MKKIMNGWLLAMCLVMAVGTAQAETIYEYLTPSAASSPAGLDFDSKGNLWFAEINGNKIGKLVPVEVKSGTSDGIVEYELPHPNSKPQYLMVSRDDTVWFSEMAGNRIGRLDPVTGKIQEYDIPTPDSEPHQLFESEDGMIWFTEFEANKIGRLDPKTGAIKEFPVHEGHPHDLVVDDEYVWFTQGGKFWARTFANNIGYLELETGKVGSIVIPPKKSVPHGMFLASDGTIWFTQFFANKISRLDFSEGFPPTVVDYQVPGKRTGAHDLVVDYNKRWVWFVANHIDSIGKLDLNKAEPGTSKGVKLFPVPTKGAHPSNLVLDKQGNVWFTEMGVYFRGRYHNKIGKLVP
ncbi:MAG: Lyase-like protein [Nitrospinaceae bacterium]